MFEHRAVLRKIVVPLCVFLLGRPDEAQAADPPAEDPFAGAIFRTRDARTGRVSSWDKTGGNRDFISFKAGETKELVRLDGPGAITHIYVTPAAGKAFLRKAVLRMFWDDEQSPSVEVPFGDFFCAGDCNPRLFASHFVVVNHGSGTIGYNAYFPMPFRKRARITLENCGKEAVTMFWYHIEYELYDRELPADTAYFHAQWRRENPTRVNPPSVPGDKLNQTIWEGLNSDRPGQLRHPRRGGEGARGRAVSHLPQPRRRLVGRRRRHDLHRRRDVAALVPRHRHRGDLRRRRLPQPGVRRPVHRRSCPSSEQGQATWRGQNSMYRWFVHDPIRFRRSIRWTIEHGHANNFENDYSSVAYWYQTEPHKPFPAASRRPAASGRSAESRRSRRRFPAPSRRRTCSRRADARAGRRWSSGPGRPTARAGRGRFFAKDGNAWISFRVPVEKAGRWRIGGYFARASDLGRYQLSGRTAGRSARRPTSSTARTGWDRRTSCRPERSCSASWTSKQASAN